MATVAGVVDVGGVAAFFDDEHPAANATTRPTTMRVRGTARS